VVVTAALTATVLLAAGCGGTGEEADSSGHTVPVATGHVHHVALHDGQVLLGAHLGLWSSPSRGQVRLVSEPPFDVMGLTASGSTLYASGHPGYGSDEPVDLGLRSSVDGGVTWSTVSLAGAVDFHRLTAAGDRLLGLTAADATLLRSDDGGTTWSDLGRRPDLVDLVMDPQDRSTVLAASVQGLLRSTDGGLTFEPLPDAPAVTLLAADSDAFHALTTDGRLLRSTDAGTTWAEQGELPGTATALAVDGDTVVAVLADRVVDSDDAGRTFTTRLLLAG
jgi:photosystem II stability/assembly factor-like uncharacterized protein